MTLKKNLFRPIFALLVWLLASPAFAQEAFPPKGLDFAIVQYKLQNGLQVILSEDDSLPLVSVVVAYGVGPIRELPGKSGIAYLMENLMFQGSENISPLQHINYIQRIGGDLNANTSFDKSFFYETVPSNQLALVLWLESDRMASLGVTSTNVERAKNTLVEEHRQRKIAEPYMDSFFMFDQILFPDFVYGHPLIGTDTDISGITEEDIRSFYRTYYVPNNAVLCISGSLNVARAKELIAKYFETIPKGNDVPDPPAAKTATPSEPETTFTDSLASSPAFYYGCRIGRVQGNDYYGLRILDTLLFRGNSSRLYKRVMKKEKLASYFNGGIEERRDLLAFRLFAVSNNSIMAGLCQKAIGSEINKLKMSPISEAELKKAKFLFQAEFLNRLSTSLGKSLFLCETYLSGIRLEDIAKEFKKYLQVTPYMITSLANKFFTAERTFVLNVETK